MWFLCWERLLSHGYECAAHPCTGHWDAWAPSGEGSCGMKSPEWLCQLKQFQGVKSVQDGMFFVLSMYTLELLLGVETWWEFSRASPCHHTAIFESRDTRNGFAWWGDVGRKSWEERGERLEGMRSEVRWRGRSFVLRSTQTYSSI